MLRTALFAASLLAALAPVAGAQTVYASSVGSDYCCDSAGLCPYLFLPNSSIVEMRGGEAGFVAELTVAGNMEPYEYVFLGMPTTAFLMNSILPMFDRSCLLHLWPVAPYALAQPAPIRLGVPFRAIPSGTVFRFQSINLR